MQKTTFTYDYYCKFEGFPKSPSVLIHWKDSQNSLKAFILRIMAIAITNENLSEDSWSRILSRLSLPVKSGQCYSTDIGMWLHMECY